jgi:predicted nuclease with TOPRIM domain
MTTENKLLNITSDDVAIETDINKLLEWRRALHKSVHDLKTRLYALQQEMNINQTEEIKSRFIRSSDARNYNIEFIEIINARIRELRGTIYKKDSPHKEKAKRYLNYLKEFKKIAKENLSEDIFNELSKKAQINSNWDID